MCIFLGQLPSRVDVVRVARKSSSPKNRSGNHHPRGTSAREPFFVTLDPGSGRPVPRPIARAAVGEEWHGAGVKEDLPVAVADFLCKLLLCVIEAAARWNVSIPPRPWA